VKKGDDVVISYYESSRSRSGSRRSDAGRRDVGHCRTAPSRARSRAWPPAARPPSRRRSSGLNKKKGTVTLKGPKGKVVTVTAREPSGSTGQVGDLVEAVYTEAVAISVEKPEKK
jgi:hypothetical protein